MTIRGERAFGRELNRATTLYPVGPRTRTTMQSCASAAKLRSGGPILPIGMKAMGLVGNPQPRTVIGTPSQAYEQGRNCRGATRHGPIGVAISNVPKGERLSAVVSSSHGERSRCSQAHDRGPGAQATDRPVAVRAAGRCTGRHRFASGTMIGGRETCTTDGP